MNISETKNFAHIPCVYCIRNTVNGKVYIGSTADLHRRMVRHKSLLLNGNHYVKKLQKEFNQFGIDAFDVFTIHEFVNNESKAERIHLEGKYIQQYHSDSDGYNTVDNITNVHVPFLEHPNEIQNRIDRSKKAVISINRFTGEKEKEFSSVAEAASFYGGETTNISAVCKGNLRYAYNKVFVYADEYDNTVDYRKEHHCKGVKQSDEHKRKRFESSKRCNRVYKYDTEGNLLAEYYSTAEAERQNNITKDCLRYHINKLYNGYIYTKTKI